MKFATIATDSHFPTPGVKKIFQILLLAGLVSVSTANGQRSVPHAPPAWQKVAEGSDDRIQPDDFDLVRGRWKGSLTYLDYTSRQEVVIPCDVDATVNKKQRVVQLVYTYPAEPAYNSRDKLRIAADGSRVQDQRVVSRKTMSDGTLEFITEETGYDDHKNCTIRRIIVLSNTTFSIAKWVKYQDGDDFIRRNIFSWKKT